MASDRELAPLYETLFELAITGLTSHYASPGYITDSSVEKSAKNVKIIARKTYEKFEFRRRLAHSVRVWQKLSLCIAYANDSLEDKSFMMPDLNEDPTKPPVPQASPLVSHFAALMTDLDCLNDVIETARNLVAASEEAQNQASESKFDQEIVKLIELCVRCSAGGYDGPVSTGSNDKSEEKWKRAVMAFKLVLKTCLQFLHNMILHNEKRKLMLWMDLFGSPPDPGQSHPIPSALRTAGANEDPSVQFAAYQQNSFRALANAMLDPVPPPGTHILEDGVVITSFQPSKIDPNGGEAKPAMNTTAEARAARAGMRDSYLQVVHERVDPRILMRETRDEVDELERLGDDPPMEDSELENGEEEDEEEEEEDEEAELEEEEEGEEDPDEYEEEPPIGERGVLTEIPLVLAPHEITALPQLLYAGMVHTVGNDHSMSSVRTNILLAQEVGKAVLRECLVYIVAWNIPEDDQYYITMQAVVESVLNDGLLPYAYTEFTESKPIMSPAQLVLVKILTSIYFKRIENTRQFPPPVPQSPLKNEPTAMGPPPPPPRMQTQTNITMIRFIFTKFRMDIVPHVCAIIEMQEKVKKKLLAPEEFPLTQWDMDRVYEGIFQYLDLLSVLAGSEQWRKLLVEWDCCFEMVALLEALERIPDPLAATAAATRSPERARSVPPTTSSLKSDPRSPTKQEPMVETPYALDPPKSNIPPLSASVLNDNSSWLLRPVTEIASDFGWRNLKKLVILVIATLVYINPEAQDSVREHGGIELITRACQLEEAPIDSGGTVRDYGQLCLNYLMEEHAENKAFVEQLHERRKTGQARRMKGAGEGGGTGTLPIRGRMMEML